MCKLWKLRYFSTLDRSLFPRIIHSKWAYQASTIHHYMRWRFNAGIRNNIVRFISDMLSFLVNGSFFLGNLRLRLGLNANPAIYNKLSSSWNLMSQMRIELPLHMILRHIFDRHILITMVPHIFYQCQIIQNLTSIMSIHSFTCSIISRWVTHCVLMGAIRMRLRILCFGNSVIIRNIYMLLPCSLHLLIFLCLWLNKWPTHWWMPTSIDCILLLLDLLCQIFNRLWRRRLISTDSIKLQNLLKDMINLILFGRFLNELAWSIWRSLHCCLTWYDNTFVVWLFMGICNLYFYLLLT